MSALHRRRNIRLKGYDYARGGAYFVTTCTQDRACLFGEIVDDTVRLNDAGVVVETWWLELGRKFPSVQTDEYVVMPNHLHGILVIEETRPVGADLVGADLRVCPGTGTVTGTGAHAGAPQPAPLRRTSLSEMVQWFKTMSTNAYIQGVKEAAWPAFRGRVWQRNYYEHIVRDEDSLQRIRKYINDNPLQWSLDRENPAKPVGMNASSTRAGPAWKNA
jgi:putative transposase